MLRREVPKPREVGAELQEKSPGPLEILLVLSEGFMLSFFHHEGLFVLPLSLQEILKELSHPDCLPLGASYMNSIFIFMLFLVIRSGFQIIIDDYNLANHRHLIFVYVYTTICVFVQIFLCIYTCCLFIYNYFFIYIHFPHILCIHISYVFQNCNVWWWNRNIKTKAIFSGRSESLGLSQGCLPLKKPATHKLNITITWISDRNITTYYDRFFFGPPYLSKISNLIAIQFSIRLKTTTYCRQYGARSYASYGSQFCFAFSVCSAWEFVHQLEVANWNLYSHEEGFRICCDWSKTFQHGFYMFWLHGFLILKPTGQARWYVGFVTHAVWHV